jgi:hypothetical protein
MVQLMPATSCHSEIKTTKRYDVCCLLSHVKIFTVESSMFTGSFLQYQHNSWHGHIESKQCCVSLQSWVSD